MTLRIHFLTFSFLGILCFLLPFSGKCQDLVSINLDSTLSVYRISGDSLVIKKEITLPGEFSGWIANADQSRMFISISRKQVICRFQTAVWKKKEIKLDLPPFSLGFNSDETWLIAGCKSESFNGKNTSVAAIDSKKFKTVKYIQTGNGQKRILPFDNPRFVAVHQIKDQNVVVVDLFESGVADSIPVMGKPTEFLQSGAGGLLITMRRPGDIACIDPVTMKLQKTILVPAGITTFACHEEGKALYLLNRMKRICYRLDLENGMITDSATTPGNVVSMDMPGNFIVLQTLQGAEIGIAEIRGKAGKLAFQSIPIGPVQQPSILGKADRNVAWNPETGEIYVGDPATNHIHVINTKSGFALRSVFTGKHSPAALWLKN